MSKYKIASAALVAGGLAVAANYVNINTFVNGAMPEKSDAMNAELSPSQKACREVFSISVNGHTLLERATINQKCMDRRQTIDTLRDLNALGANAPALSEILGQVVQPSLQALAPVLVESMSKMPLQDSKPEAPKP